jgi:hypothetical protein
MLYSLNKKYQQAKRIIDSLDHNAQATLTTICHDIQAAEKALLTGAEGHFNRCIDICRGLCCKNVRVDEIINTGDFIFILTASPHIRTVIGRSLKQESPFFPSNCIFLKDDIGPCLFPEDSRPEACIVTFCTDDFPIENEIREVTKAFRRLHGFVRKRRLAGLFRHLSGAVQEIW